MHAANNFHGGPNAIFNVDKKGLSMYHKPPHIISGITYRPQAATSGRSKTVTVTVAGNAMGQQVPPFFFSWKAFC